MPQTLKIIGYIEKQKFIVLIDLGSTHNFIIKKLVECLDCFVYLVTNFQVLVANGWRIHCGGKCLNIKYSMENCNLSSLMYATPIGGVDFSLGVRCLRTFSMVSTNYNELFVRFELEWIKYEFKELKPPSSKVIISRRMEKLLRNGSIGFIVSFYSMEMKHKYENNLEELKCTLKNNHKVFQEYTKCLSSSRDHEHKIEFILGSTPTKRPYRYPHQQKGENEKLVQDMLEASII